MENKAGITLLNFPEIFPCKIIGRINRFTVRVNVLGKVTKASLNNTGRLKELLCPGSTGYCLPGHQKLRYRLFAINGKKFASVIDTKIQAEAFEVALAKGLIPTFRGYRLIKRNIRVGRSIIDYELGGKDRLIVELKSAVMRLNDLSGYPDCPTERGRKQLEDLIAYARSGGNSAVFFMTSLEGVRGITPNREADPELYLLMKEADKVGVRMGGMNILFHPESRNVVLSNPDLPVVL